MSKTLILSDVHGNLPALEKVLKKAGNVDQYIILGDVVNYGPWNNECVQLIDTLNNCHKLKGNHEKFFIKGESKIENKLIKDFFKVSYKDFNEYNSIIKYKDSYLFETYICKHTINNEYIYSDTKIKLDNNYIIGHSHHQFELNLGNFFLINPGSVGQNRKRTNLANYAIYDSEKKIFEFCSTFYNINFLINEMKKRKYPDKCIRYYIERAF